MQQLYGLIGYPLNHSFSPGFFQQKFRSENIDADYRSFPLSSVSEFPSLIADNRHLRGLNVTIPYKETIIPYLNELDSAAAKVGAVNCIAFRSGRTIGYNTDIIGFERSLTPFLKPFHTSALILGTGGAARAVKFVLDKLGITCLSVSRSGNNGSLKYEEVTPELIASHKIIINTTPLGMFPNVDSCPSLPYKSLDSSNLLYDLVYNPLETKFLSLGHEQGAIIKNGLEMLHIQAIASWDIWDDIGR